MESKTLVIDLPKDAGNYMNIADLCKTKFRIAIGLQLKGHHCVIRGVEDLVIDNRIKVLVKYELHKIGTDFYVPYYGATREQRPYEFTFDFNNSFDFNTTFNIPKDQFFDINS